jgi:hypothetical protein
MIAFSQIPEGNGVDLMRVVTTGTKPVPGQSNVVYTTITINPMPDSTPANFVQQLNGATALEDLLIEAEIQGANVLVTLVDFELTKWTLKQMGQLPRFAHLLPDAN